MYKIADSKLMHEVELVIEIQGYATIEYDGMELSYRKEQGELITLLMRITDLKRYIKVRLGDDYNKERMILVIPEGIDYVCSLFYNWVGGEIDICGRLIDEVELPYSCKTLGDRAFYGCYNLEKVDWKNVQKINYRALLHTRIRQCQIPAHIETESQVCSNYDEAKKAGEVVED